MCVYMQLPLGDPKTCLPGSTCLQTSTLFPTLMPSDDPQTSCSMPEYVLVCVCACIFSPQGFFAMFHVIIQVNKHEQWERRIWVKDGVLNRKHCQWRLLTLPVKSCTQQTSCFGFQVYFEGFISVGHCQGLKMSHHRIYYMFYTILYSVFPAAPGTQCITITGETLNLRICITLIYFIDRAL